MMVEEDVDEVGKQERKNFVRLVVPNVPAELWRWKR